MVAAFDAGTAWPLTVTVPSSLTRFVQLASEYTL